MKKILTLLLALSLIFGLFAGMAGTVSADDYYGDKYIAWDNGDGTCTISYYSEYADATEIYVPKYVNGMRVAALADRCFEGFYNLETLILPEHLSYISAYAFQGCGKLKSVTLPASVTELNPEAFNGSALREINVSSGSSAFCSVNGVLFSKDKKTLLRYPCGNEAKSYTIPSGVKAIADYAFYGCENLTSITIPDGVISIGNNAFEYCWDLSSVNIPDSVVSIENYAFLNSGIENGIPFVLSKNVSYVGIQALTSAVSITVSSENPYFTSENGVLFSKDMSKLIQYPEHSAARSYEIPSTVTEICPAAFDETFNLQSVSIPDSVVSIGEAAFYGSGLRSVVIPHGVREIQNYTFSDCNKLSQVLLPDNLTTINMSAFSWCSSLQDITLPDSVQTIGDAAFSYCESLTKMTLPFGIMHISYDLFSGCTSLTTLVIPASVGVIYPWAFHECAALSSVEFTGTAEQWNAMHIYINEDEESVIKTLPIQFTGIGYEDNLFSYVEDGRCGKVMLSTLSDTGKSRSLLEIPEEVDGKPIEMIAAYAFAKANVREVVLPEGIKTLGDDAFVYCYNLKNVTLPSTLTLIGDGAFNNCRSLQSITIPDGITELPSSLFIECVSLMDVTLPENLTSMRDSVFFDCYSLKSINLPDQLTYIPNCTFTGCESLTSVDLPENLKAIGSEAFWHCNSLENITLPDGIETINSRAFDECINLNWIYIPDSVSYLGNDIFWGCNNLKSIFYEGSYTQWKAIEDIEYALYDCNAMVYYDCNPVVGKFMDVKASDWFKDSVAYVYENELMNGTSDMLFTPSGSLTRGQLVTILYRVAGEPAVETPADFSDVASGRYYSNAVAWAAANSIVTGYNDGTFKPDNKITREQIATILYRYEGTPEVTGTLDFPDAEKVSTYAKDAMTWAVSEGLITGIKSNGVTTLAPKNTATRAQIATIIMRYLEAE